MHLLQGVNLIELQLNLLQTHYPGQSAGDRQATLRALKTADNTRTRQQHILVEMLQRADGLPDSDQPPSVLRARRDIGDLRCAPPR